MKLAGFKFYDTPSFELRSFIPYDYRKVLEKYSLSSYGDGILLSFINVTLIDVTLISNDFDVQMQMHSDIRCVGNDVSIFIITDGDYSLLKTDNEIVHLLKDGVFYEANIQCRPRVYERIKCKAAVNV